MAWFNQIEPGWYFVRRVGNGVYVGEKLDGSLLPKELQGGHGDEHNIAIPRDAKKGDFSQHSEHYGHFNTRVIAATEEIKYKFDYCHSDNKVDAFSPKALEHVISLLEFEGSRALVRRE